LRFKLSFRDLVEMMAERGIDLRTRRSCAGIQRYVPEFEKRWNWFACKAGGHGASMKLTRKSKVAGLIYIAPLNSNGQTG